MTKEHELEILRTAIRDLGEDSYCGPWLASIAGEVERDVRDDICPAYTLQRAQHESIDMLALASEEAARTVERAKVEAERLIGFARMSVEKIKDESVDSLRSAIRRICGDFCLPCRTRRGEK